MPFKIIPYSFILVARCTVNAVRPTLLFICVQFVCKQVPTLTPFDVKCGKTPLHQLVSIIRISCFHRPFLCDAPQRMQSKKKFTHSIYGKPYKGFREYSQKIRSIATGCKEHFYLFVSILKMPVRLFDPDRVKLCIAKYFFNIT